jgi:hypothetical protein
MRFSYKRQQVRHLPLLLTLVFALLAAEGRASAQPQTTPQVENLANVSFNADIRVFAVMVALNAAGYDYETPNRQMSAARQLVRQEVRKADAKILGRLQSFYLEHRQNMDPVRQASAYISLALLIEGPPEFRLTVSKKDLPEDVLQVVGFEELVRDLFQQVNLARLWDTCQSYYTAELAAYRPVFVDLIRQTLSYFRIPPRIVLDREIVVIPELIGPSRIVNARNLERTYYIIPGPADPPGENRDQLQHEYLHFLLDPLIEKFGTPLLKYEKLLDVAQNQPHVRSEYQNRYMGVVAESLVDTLILRMNPTADPNRDLVTLFRRGLIFSPYFYRALASYEADQTQTMPAYVETLFAGVNEKIIRQDEAAIAQLETQYGQEEEIKRQAEREDQQRRLRASHVNTLLLEAQESVRQQQYDAARTKLQEVLQQDPESATAYFYLAQIASQQKDYAAAFSLYQRADQSEKATPVIHAWSKLRMARYLASQGNFTQARTYLTEVAQMQGELDGAREQAQSSLAELPKE